MPLPSLTRALPPGALSAGARLLADAVAASLPIGSEARRPAVQTLPPLQAPLTYAALGASDVVGWGTAGPQQEG